MGGSRGCGVGGAGRQGCEPAGRPPGAGSRHPSNLPLRPLFLLSVLAWLMFFLRGHRIQALALPAVGLVTPPALHLATSALALAVTLADVEHAAWQRSTYMGTHLHAAFARLLSRGTWALFRPWAAAPRSAHPDRVTVLVVVAMTIALGALLPAQVVAASQRAARDCFRARAAPPDQQAPPPRPWASLDALLLAAILHFACWLVVWFVLEEVDAWLVGGGWGACAL